MIAVGRKRKRLVLESVSKTQDAFGQARETWTAVGTFWAEIKALSGRELVNAKEIKADVSVQIKTRWLGFVPTPASCRWKLTTTLGTRYFPIGSTIDADEQHIEMTYLCTEYVAN